MKNWDYEQTVKLRHNEELIKVDVETGDMSKITKRNNNLPKGKSVLDYSRFHIGNDLFTKAMLKGNLMTNEELGIVSHMSSLAEINTNSLRPITDDTTLKELSERFRVDRRRVEAIFKKLFHLGVYMQLRYFSDSEQQEVQYWVLNPYISWKGKLKTDSIFMQFADTTIAKLLK